MFSSDRPARDNLVDELKQKIRSEKAMLEHRIVLDEEDAPEERDRPHRAKKLTEVFKAMGFEG
jgi:hypothetical protein